MESTTCACGCGQHTQKTETGAQRRYVNGHNRRGRGKGWFEAGYRYISVNGKKIGEHRYIMEQTLGRKLTRNEVVHHVDHDKFNNDADNLVLLSRGEHSRMRGGRRSRWTEEERRRAAELRERGLSIQEVAWVLGRSFSSTIKHVCNRRFDKPRETLA